MIRKVIKVLGLALGAAVTLVLAAAAIFVVSFDPNDYRSLIENSVASLIDRDVHINGELELAPSLIPTLVVHGVTIANPSWASRPTMASAERLTAKIALRPLLRRRIEIASVILEGVVAELERDANSRGNWEFAALTDPDTAAASNSGFTTTVAIVELRDIRVRYTDEAGAVTELAIEQLALERPAPGVVAVAADARFDAIPLHIEWRAGPFDDSQAAAGLAWPIAMDADIGGTAVTMAGRLRAPLAFTEAEFELSLSGSDAGQFQALFDLPPSDGLVYALTGRARVGPDSLVVSELGGRLSNGRVFRDLEVQSGSALVARGERVAIDVAGFASGEPFAVALQAGTVRELIERTDSWPIDVEASLGEANLQASGTVASEASGLRASVDLAVNGNVVESLNRLRTLGLPDIGAIDLATALDVDAERAVFRDLRLNVADTDLSGTLDVSFVGTKPAVDAVIHVPRIDIEGGRGAPGQPANSEAWLDRPIPQGWLDAIDAAVALRVGEISFPGAFPGTLAEAVEISATLLDGGLDASALGARVLGIEIAGHGRLGVIDDQMQIAIELKSPRVDLRELMTKLSVSGEARAAATESLDSSAGALDGAAEVLNSAAEAVDGSAEDILLTLQASGSTIRSAARSAAIALRGERADIELAVNDTSLRADLATFTVGVEPGQPVRLLTSGIWSATQAERSLAAPFDLSLQSVSLPELLATGDRGPALELSFGLTSRYRDTPVELEGEIDDVLRVARSIPADFQVTGRWGPWSAQAVGTLNPVAGLIGTSVDFELATDDLIAAGSLLDLDGLPAGAGSVAARATLGASSVSLAVASVAAPGLAGAGTVELDWAERPAIVGSLQLSSVDLDPYLWPADEASAVPTQAQPFVLSQLYSATPIDWRVLSRQDIAVEVGVDLLRVRQFVSESVFADIRLADGDMHTILDLDGGRIQADLAIDTGAGAPAVSLRIVGNGIALAADRSGQVVEGTPAIDAQIDLTGRGDSVLALMESLNGDVLAYMHGGRMQQAGMRFLFGSVLYQLIDVVNPFSARQDYMEIECAGAYFAVNEGVIATENGIIMQTPELQVIGVGSANLVSGALLMRFNTKRRKGIVPSIGSVVNEFVELTGTVDQPRIGVSGERAARRGLLAIATAGLSIVATDMFRRITSGDACAELSNLVGAPAAPAD